MKKVYCRKCKWGHNGGYYGTEYCWRTNEYTETNTNKDEKLKINSGGECQNFSPNFREGIKNKLFG